jgi:hypothetical protein
VSRSGTFQECRRNRRPAGGTRCGIDVALAGMLMVEPAATPDFAPRKAASISPSRTINDSSNRAGGEAARIRAGRACRSGSLQCPCRLKVWCRYRLPTEVRQAGVVCLADGKTALGIVGRYGSGGMGSAVWNTAHCFSPAMKICDELYITHFWNRTSE